MFEQIIQFFEKHAFGVCEWWGEKLGIKISSIRLFFIYISFISAGFSFLIYMIMAFVLEHKEQFKSLFTRRKKTIWDL